MSFNEGDTVEIIRDDYPYSGQLGHVTYVYADGSGYVVELDNGTVRSYFCSEVRSADPKRKALIELAETLDKARLQANAIEEMAPQSWVYGDIAQVLVVVLCALTGRFEVGDIYDLLLDGNTVREALEVVAKNGK